jgi:hypothetical protein
MTVNKAIDILVSHREYETTGELKEALALSIQALSTIDAIINAWIKLADFKKDGEQ